jgi:hypothetical protein
MAITINRQKINQVLEEHNICGLIMSYEIDYPFVNVWYYCLRTHTSDNKFMWRITQAMPHQAPQANIIQKGTN